MAVKKRERSDVTFEIVEHIGVLTTTPNGWTKELNIVAWNGGSEKYDIREWDLEHEKMSRGVTLHKDEAKKVMELLKERKFGDLNNGESRDNVASKAFRKNNYGDLAFEIIEHIGVISVYPTGWKKILNIVVWNGGVKSLISGIGRRTVNICQEALRCTMKKPRSCLNFLKGESCKKCYTEPERSISGRK